MRFEGREYTWMTGFYWSLTVMSTLGFGDITFHSDLGRFFTLIVLISGIVFLIVLLPFTFVNFFYQPWLDAQQKAQTPLKLPEKTKDHIIITNLDPVTVSLIPKLKKYNYPYVIVVPNLNEAQTLHNQGYKVVIGDYDDPETFKNLCLQNAALVLVTNDDMTNTSISFTVRELTGKIPIVVDADNDNSVDILEHAGNTHVFQFMKMLGKGMAMRGKGTALGASVVGNFGQLLIAEAPVTGTPFENKNLISTRIREKTGLSVVGIWERGKFIPPLPQTIITAAQVLVMAGSEEQLSNYEKTFNTSTPLNNEDAPVLILGGGRVGSTAAKTLKECQIPYTIVEKSRAIIKKNNEHHIYGDATDLNVLRDAGIERARSVLVTTHNDAMNIHLTFYCRSLRPDIEIISRAVEEKTVAKLYRAGADLVMSSATLGANSILNFLRPNELSMFTEGLNIFSRKVPRVLIGTSLIEGSIREKTGCTVIAINRQGKQIVSPDPTTILKEQDEIIMIGSPDAEGIFVTKYLNKKKW
jgi:Trk K+ transport system NAD-binding subunit